MSSAMCQEISFVKALPNYDFALLKVDFAANSRKDWFKGRAAFPYIKVSRRQLGEGEPVYAFGYPLSDASAQKFGNVTIGQASLRPRVTSAIVSSTLVATKMLMTSSDPKVYVLDRALNYGNSGGPIIALETGRVHAFCSQFQPVSIKQQHIADQSGKPITIIIPSLYGIVSSLGNQEILDLLATYNVPIVDE